MNDNIIRYNFKGGENEFSSSVRACLNIIGYLIHKRKKVFKSDLDFWKYLPDNLCGADLSKLNEYQKEFIFSHFLINRIIVYFTKIQDS